ncbi:MAG: SPASM domain-containing protein [Planctomycetota bacterium]
MNHFLRPELIGEAPPLVEPASAKEDALDRVAIEEAQRAVLSEELLSHRLVFASRPYEAHIQFGTVCNQSCVMCWDGHNPPALKMPPSLLDKVQRELAPTLSLVTPYSGSEPLAANWATARQLAEDHDVRIALTTNVELLDAVVFESIAPWLETLMLSVDSHRPEVLARIRRTRHPKRILSNLETAARRARRHGIECLAQIVFLTLNAADLPDTMRDFARRGIETVSIIPMIDVNGHSRAIDARTQLEASQIAAIHERCRHVAREQGLRLLWHVDTFECLDARPDPVPTDPRKHEQEIWREKLQRYLPGYCAFVPQSVRIDVAGRVSPCCYDVDGDLQYGHLGESSFETLWNGPAARDLRRAMQTQDLPALCRGCRFVQPVPARSHLPCHERLAEIRFPGSLPGFDVEGPEHLLRTETPPVLSWRRPNRKIREYVVVFVLGGEVPLFRRDHPVHHAEELPVVAPRGRRTVRVPIPEDLWSELRENLGYWWTVYALDENPCTPALRSTEARCLIRHRAIGRIPDSPLRYPES